MKSSVMYEKKFTCKGCKNREIGCHGYCDEYKNIKAWNDKVKESRHRLKIVCDYIYDTRYKNVYNKH